MEAATIGYKLRKRWKLLLGVAVLWLWVVFPIPFLPFFNVPFDPSAIQALLITVAVISIPFTLLAIFMNKGSNARADRY